MTIRRVSDRLRQDDRLVSLPRNVGLLQRYEHDDGRRGALQNPVGGRVSGTQQPNGESGQCAKDTAEEHAPKRYGETAMRRVQPQLEHAPDDNASVGSLPGVFIVTGSRCVTR